MSSTVQKLRAIEGAMLEGTVVESAIAELYEAEVGGHIYRVFERAVREHATAKAAVVHGAPLKRHLVEKSIKH